jgi:hypothetical protein
VEPIANRKLGVVQREPKRVADQKFCESSAIQSTLFSSG